MEAGHDQFAVAPVNSMGVGMDNLGNLDAIDQAVEARVSNH
jgi:hypothetical protein